MTPIMLEQELLDAIEMHGESTYPNEGAGFLMGDSTAGIVVKSLLPVENRREAEAQYNRYELGPRDFMQAELEAARLGLSVVGVFHSHPDHPAQPSAFDRNHALPNFAYLITSVMQQQAVITRGWLLKEDRSAFDEIEIHNQPLIAGDNHG